MIDTIYGDQYTFEIELKQVDDFSCGPKYWVIKVLDQEKNDRVIPVVTREESVKRNQFLMSRSFLSMISETFDQAYAKCIEIESMGLTEWYEKILTENGYYDA